MATLALGNGGGDLSFPFFLPLFADILALPVLAEATAALRNQHVTSYGDGAWTPRKARYLEKGMEMNSMAWMDRLTCGCRSRGPRGRPSGQFG